VISELISIIFLILGILFLETSYHNLDLIYNRYLFSMITGMNLVRFPEKAAITGEITPIKDVYSDSLDCILIGMFFLSLSTLILLTKNFLMYVRNKKL